MVAVSFKNRNKTQLVLLDSGSSYHVQNKLDHLQAYFIKNEGHVNMKVANGEDMPVTYIGWVPGLGNTAVSPVATDHIASVSQLIQEGHSVQFFNKDYNGRTILGKPVAVCISNNTRGIEIYGYCTSNGHFMIRKEDFYSMYAPEQEEQVRTLAITVDENGDAVFTPEQIERAHLVRHMHNVFGHPSDKTLTNCFNNGLLIGTPLTASDIVNCPILLGECTA